jgi:single-stranded-DNA-specific exonuclease
MSIGIDCLLATSEAAAQPLAQQLDEFNRQRRGIEAEMQTLALAAVRGMELPQRGTRRSGLCIYDPAWHQGVVGLVASRIKDRVRRPVIAFAQAGDEGWLRGSARSVPGVHIRDVIDAVATRHPDLVGVFGGHAMAAGLSLRLAHLDRFAAAFDAEVAQWLARCELDESLLTDGALQESELSLDTAQQLRAAGPWGQGFAEPCFDGCFRITHARVVGERHVKLRVQPEGSQAIFDAIAFGYLDDETRDVPQGRVELVYRLDINVYQGQRRLQLLVEQLQSPA